MPTGYSSVTALNFQPVLGSMRTNEQRTLGSQERFVIPKSNIAISTNVAAA
jgi:hypothetical protein